MDGVGCGILAKLAFNQQVRVRYNSISSLNREIEFFLDQNPDHFLLITDLSPNEETEKRLEAFYRENRMVQLLDHHKTALHLNSYEWGYVLVEDKNGLTSATSLLYQYLVNHELLEATDAITEFVELVRQYDTWEWEKYNNKKALRLNTLFFLVSIDEFEEKIIQRLQSSDHFEFDEFEKKLLEMEENKIDRYIKRKKRELIQFQIGQYLVGIVYAELYHSELGNELGKEFSHIDYIAILNLGGKRMSFRTIHDDIDVSKIASAYGGGGHAKASGCSLTSIVFKQFVEETYHLEPIQEDAKRNRYNLKDTAFGTLYKNHKEDVLFIYPLEEKTWVIEKNKNKIDQFFTSFNVAERFLKRNYSAWLAKDEQFVKFLMDEIKR